MVFNDDKEDVLAEEGLPEVEDEDELEKDDDTVDMFGGEDPEATRERDWM
ncbi:MAG TPA: hypothetical protein VJL57_03065 [Candidatus Paceibacterota bacterium]